MLHGGQSLDPFRHSIKAAGFAGGNLWRSLFFMLTRFVPAPNNSGGRYKPARLVLMLLNDLLIQVRGGGEGEIASMA